MPISRPIDDLPEKSRREGVFPDAELTVTSMLARRWHEKYVEQGRHEYAAAIADLPFRASNVAFRCDRQMFYAMTDTARSNPDSIADAWRFGLGQMVHDQLQQVLTDLGDGWVPEVVVDLRTIGIEGSAHADLVHYDAAGNADHVVELKTVNGFSFKLSATSFKGPPEGPRHSHILQGAMAAKALGAPKVSVAYLAMENVSVDLAKQYTDTEVGRFAAEWTYDVAGLEPLIDQERARIARLVQASRLKLRPGRTLSDPTIAAGAAVFNTDTGAWHVVEGDVVVSAGKTWFCNYCGWRDQCSSDGPDAQSVEVEL